MILKMKIFRPIHLVAALLMLFAQSSNAQATSAAGKELFKNYCASCHAKDMKSAGTGPALGGSQARWNDDAALYSWIRNSQAMIASGHPRAVELWNQYKPNIMTAFPNLTDDDIASILLYVDEVYTGAGAAAKVADAGAAAGPVKEEESNDGLLYGGLALFLLVLTLVLTRIISNLNQIAAAKEGIEYEKKTLYQTLTSQGIMFALIVLGGYTTVNKAINMGRQQNYAPEQPIKFSHATHSGLHKIDCQYCHDGARRSKQSVIPAANTCMNCHRAIKVGSQYGTQELTKIYASIGYDPTTNVYIEDYEKKTEDEIKEIYTKWIADNYISAKEIQALDAEGEREVNRQWKELVKSLTNDQKKKIQGPIEWVRIHNLADHAYFNHAQHVSVGKVECQTCHGPVETMDVVYQYSPLSMGWCINCHRQTEVKFKENEYYKSYEQYHKDIQSGKKEKVTVADIGGLECQKCHY